MTHWLLIGSLWLNGQFANTIHKDFPTKRACVAAMHKLGATPHANGVWTLAEDDGSAMRAICLGPHLERAGGIPG